MNRRKKNILSAVRGLEEEGVRCNKGENKPIVQTLKCEVFKSQLSKDSVLNVWGGSGRPESSLVLWSIHGLPLQF